MKEIVTFKYGSFTDYKGLVHQVTVCSVSQRRELSKTDEVSLSIEDYMVPVEKTLSFGVSICSPVDKYDKARGEMIAYNRAIDYERCPVLTSSQAGFFNSTTVDILTENYLEYIQRDPGSVLDGYDDAKRKFLEDQKLKEEVYKMTDADKAKVKIIANTNQSEIDHAKKIIKFLQSEIDYAESFL